MGTYQYTTAVHPSLDKIKLRLSVLLVLCLAHSLSLSMSAPQNFAPGNDRHLSQYVDSPAIPTIRSSCVCGSLSVLVEGVTLHTPTADCHCPKCRKYHVAGFVSYVQVPNASLTWVGESKASFRDACLESGPVDRIYCSSCYTKMASLRLDGSDEVLVNLGPLEDDTIPDAIWMDWQFQRRQLQLASKAVWPTATANWEELEFSERPSMRNVQGGCGCGASRYQIRYHQPSELQHCYCRLCRQLSGSAFQTWVPIQEEFFSWTTPEPQFLKTTDHGGRHVCGKCGSVMTIVYDEDDGTVWPAAGGFDDATLPPTREAMSDYLERVCHICCIWKQNWYKLPNDGNERIDKAG